MIGIILAAAIWDTYPRLTCQYDVITFCDNTLTGCDRRQGTGVLTFDFPKNELHSLYSKKLQHISARFHYATQSSFVNDINSVYAESTLYSWGKVTKSKVTPDEIEGFAQSAGGDDQAFTARMVCHPAQ